MKKGQWQGGWQTKCTKGKGVPSKGKGYQGSMYNIDGENFGGAWGGSNGYSGLSAGFFGCLTEESEPED